MRSSSFSPSPSLRWIFDYINHHFAIFLRRREKHFENLVRLNSKPRRTYDEQWSEWRNSRVFRHRARFFLLRSSDEWFSMIRRVPLTLTLGLLRDLQMFLRGTSRVHGKFEARTASGVQQLVKYLETN